MKSQTYIKTGTATHTLDSEGRLITRIPIQFKRRAGRAVITLPDGTTAAEGQATRPWDGKATPEQLRIARGVKWRRMLDKGEAKSMREIAELEGVDERYVSRLIHATLIPPWEMQKILDQ